MKFPLSMIFLIVIVITLCGCTNADSDPTKNSPDTNQDKMHSGNVSVLRVGEAWNIESLDPSDHEPGILLSEKALITETLIGVNSDFSIKPKLAVSWNQTNNTSWEFKLRDNVTFHDGVSLTATEVKFSLDRAMERDPLICNLMRYDYSEEVNSSVIRIVTKDINPIVPAILAYPSTAIISKSSLNSEGKFSKPVGTGPMMYENFDLSTRSLAVVRNTNWWGGKTGIDRLIIRPIEDPNSRALAIEKGEVDMTIDIPYSEVDRLNNTAGISVMTFETPRVYMINCNLQRPAINDIRVRKAISYAINRRVIVDKVLYGVGRPAAGIFLPTMAWANKSLKPYPYDTIKAGELLTTAGLTDINGDGIREYHGKPFELIIITYPNRPAQPKMAEAISAQLQNIGISSKVIVMEYGALQNQRKTGNWDLYLLASSISLIPDPDYVMTNWFTTGAVDNQPQYSNQEVDRKVYEARITKDQDDRYRRFAEVEGILYDEVPTIPVAYYGIPIVIRDNVKGYTFDPTSHDYSINPEIQIVG